MLIDSSSLLPLHLPMAEYPVGMRMKGWTRASLRHIARRERYSPFSFSSCEVMKVSKNPETNSDGAHKISGQQDRPQRTFERGTTHIPKRFKTRQHHEHRTIYHTKTELKGNRVRLYMCMCVHPTDCGKFGPGEKSRRTRRRLHRSPRGRSAEERSHATRCRSRARLNESMRSFSEVSDRCEHDQPGERGPPFFLLFRFFYYRSSLRPVLQLPGCVPGVCP